MCMFTVFTYIFPPRCRNIYNLFILKLNSIKITINLSTKCVDEYVKTKLKSLRNSYTKAKKPQSSGSARKSLSKRATWIRDKLQFLEPYIATRASTSSIDVVSILMDFIFLIHFISNCPAM